MSEDTDTKTLIDYTQTLKGSDDADLMIGSGARNPDGTPSVTSITLLKACHEVLFGLRPAEQEKFSYSDMVKRGKIYDAMVAGELLGPREINIITDRLTMLRPDLAYAVAKILDPVGVEKVSV